MAQRRKSRKVAEEQSAWETPLPLFASTAEEIKRAIERNSIKRGSFIIKNLVSLNFDQLLQKVANFAQTYDRESWFERADTLHIDKEALRMLERVPIAYPYYFCTPEILRQHPELVMYYRNAAMVSQKVMNGLGLNTSSYEAGAAPSEEIAQELSQRFNTIISGLVKVSPITSRRHLEMAYTNLGESFGGSWRNEVGRLAYAEVLSPLALYLHRRGVLASILYKLKGRIIAQEEEETINRRQTYTLNLTESIDLDEKLRQLEEQRIIYREFLLKNGHRLQIDRQITWRDDKGKPYKIGPDLSSLSEDEKVLFWSGELKGGADPAGSDEHWKTATRAFDRILEAAERTNRPKPKLSFIATIFVERVAREAEMLIAQGKLYSVYNLTQMADEPQKQQQFLEEVANFLGYPPESKTELQEGNQ